MSGVSSVREKLLDTAEALFADSGYHGVSVRDITTAAGVRVASINDLFGSKEQLFQVVIARRAGSINDDRLSMLEQVEPGLPPKAQLQQIVEAFARPLLSRSETSDGWRSYLRLISQLSNTRSVVLVLIADHFNPIALRFIQAIGDAVPGLDQRQRLVAYQLMVSSVMSIFADNYRINVLSANVYQSSEFEHHYQDLVRYISGGIFAMTHHDGQLTVR